MDNIDRLRWRCRRGSLELDLLLERYLENHYACANANEKKVFQQLLKLEDSELLPYLMGEKRPGNESFIALINKIRRQPEPVTSICGLPDGLTSLNKP